jgi:hypothetical protein
MYLQISHDRCKYITVAQNTDLDVDNQRVISRLVHSRHTFDIMHGLVNSLRNEILGLVSISAYITCSIGSQFEYLKNGDRFATVGSAYKGQESVSHKVKKELIKPVENKLEVKDRLTGALSSVLPAFINKKDR